MAEIALKQTTSCFLRLARNLELIECLSGVILVRVQLPCTHTWTWMLSAPSSSVLYTQTVRVRQLPVLFEMSWMRHRSNEQTKSRENEGVLSRDHVILDQSADR